MKNILKVVYKEDKNYRDFVFNELISELFEKYKFKFVYTDKKGYLSNTLKLPFKWEKNNDKKIKELLEKWYKQHEIKIKWKGIIYIIADKKEIEKFLADNIVCLDSDCKNHVEEVYYEVLDILFDNSYYKLKEIKLNNEDRYEEFSNIFHEHTYWRDENDIFATFYYKNVLKNYEKLFIKNNIEEIIIEFYNDNWKKIVENKYKTKMLKKIFEEEKSNDRIPF